MDGLSLFFVFFFGIAALIPALWAIGAMIRGDKGYWPCIVGFGFALGLLLVTFIGIGTNWGGCPVNGGSSEGAVQCFTADGTDPTCKPDVWKIECGQSVSCGDPPRTLPAHTFCPAGQITEFEFCEKIQTGGVKQPWATWSDLSFVAAGLWILWSLHFFVSPRTISLDSAIDNPMTRIGWLSVTYGMIVIFMGPPSQWFHASLKDWGGWFDSMSVAIWLVFSAAYVIYLRTAGMWDKWRDARGTIFVLCLWGGVVIGCGFIAIAPKLRLLTYFLGGVPWGVAELFYVFKDVKNTNTDIKYKRTGWLFWVNLTLLAGTMLLWCFYNPAISFMTSPSACHSRESFPGHALFHILASISTMVTFVSFASERRIRS